MSYESYLKKHYAEAHARTYGPPKKFSGAAMIEHLAKIEREAAQPPHQRVPAVINLRIPEWQRITEEVCAKHGVAIKDVLGQRKTLAYVKREAWWRIRNELPGPPSYNLIAKWFGLSNHTTIIIGIRRYVAAQARSAGRL